MKDRAIFTALAEILEVPNQGPDSEINPYLTVARFVFADDKGATTSTATKTGLQGIEADDFDEVIKSSLHMPVKMNFTGTGVASHSGSYVIGHIRGMEKNDDNQLIANAVLYAEEYPEEILYLKESFASGDAPGISYEMAYGESIVKNGVEWLKKMITCAATFVRQPAYGNRTALLALASAKDTTEFVATMKTLVAEAEGTEESIPINEGGKNVDELETAQAEIIKFKAEAETKTAEVSRLTEELDARTGEVTTLNETIATLQREKAVDVRVRKYTEAGFMLEADAEKAEKKKSFWLALSDESFDEYLADLVSAKASAKPEPKKAEAGNREPFPRLEVPSNVEGETPSFRFRD